MPVITKKSIDGIKLELRNRYSNLTHMLETRELKSGFEGCKSHSSWVDKESMCATIGSKVDIELAVNDFKTIIDLIKKEIK